MSKKKNHAMLWTIQVDDVADEMNDLLREAETLDEQVCLQPSAKALWVCTLSYSPVGVRGEYRIVPVGRDLK